MKWISIKDHWPDWGSYYLVIERGQVNFLFYEGEDLWVWMNGEEWPHDVTHWMPLPEPPKE